MINDTTFAPCSFELHKKNQRRLAINSAISITVPSVVESSRSKDEVVPRLGKRTGESYKQTDIDKILSVY